MWIPATHCAPIEALKTRKRDLPRESCTGGRQSERESGERDGEDQSRPGMTALSTDKKSDNRGKVGESRNGLIDRGPIFVLKLEFGLSDTIREQKRQ